MNVLVVHPYISILGGGERVCFHVIRALLEDGHDVTLVSEPINAHILRSLTGFTLEKIPHLLYGKFKPRIKKFSVYQRILHHIISKSKIRSKLRKFDIEFLTQDVAFTLDVADTKIAYVYFPEYMVHLETAKPSTRWFWGTYYAPVKSYWRKQIDKIRLFLGVSNYTKGKVKEKWNKDAVTVYPPVDVEKFEPAPEKEDVVVSVGRFIPSKNYEAVIQVAELLPEVKFKIIGIKQDFEYYEKIRRFKPNNVTLLTDLSQEELILQLSRAKVYLHTMVGEHFGISIVEAMASGCIPIVHNSGGATEAIADLGYAYTTIKECVKYVGRSLDEYDIIDKRALVERAGIFNSKQFEENIKNIFRDIHE